MKRVFWIFLALFLLTTSTVEAFTDDIDAVDRNGRVIESVTVDDDIYISGLCSSAVDEFVDIYVVSKRSNWNDEDILNDVTDDIEQIEGDEEGELPLTRVWFSRLDIGEYDIVVDVDRDGEFDEDLDCVDRNGGTGFKVISGATLTVSEGSKNPDEDFKWKPEKNDPFVTFLQVRLRNDDEEDVLIEGIELAPRGSGNDRNMILEVIVAEDRGSDGKYVDGSDKVWGIGTYPHDNRSVVIETNVVLKEKESINLVVAYLMGKGIGNADTFSVSLTDVEATGLTSDGEARVIGLSVSSIEMETNGSGDAIEVERDSDDVLVVSSNTTNKNSNSSVSLVENSDSEGGLLAGIFSRNKDSYDDRDGPWLPPIGVRVGFLILLGLIVLIFIWKILRAIFTMFL